MAGRKVFTAGEVLQAADVNDFLMDQSVMVFAGTAARGSAIPSPTEGMVTYLQDSDEVEKYTTTWEPVGVAPGLAFIASATMSAVASQSFDNVFTSTYDNYRIIFVGEASTLISLQIRLRASGTDASGSDYTRQRIYASSTGITAARSTGTSYFPGDASTDPNMMVLDVGNPAKASKTAFVGQNLLNESTATAQIFQHTGLHGLTTAYDGFTLLPSSGTLTGTISVYGYRKA